jgi:hypothetical protein
VREPPHGERVDPVAIGEVDRGAENEVFAQRDALRRDRISSFRYLILRSTKKSELEALTTLQRMTTLQRTTGDAQGDSSDEPVP